MTVLKKSSFLARARVSACVRERPHAELSPEELEELLEDECAWLHMAVPGCAWLRPAAPGGAWLGLVGQGLGETPHAMSRL